MSDGAEDPTIVDPPVFDLTPPPHVQAMIDLLEQMLADVRRGEIEGIGVATALRDGHSGDGYVRGRASIMTLHFAAAHLAHRVLTHCEHQPAEPDPDDDA